MNSILAKLATLAIMIAMVSGFYKDLPLGDNIYRAFIIVTVFSALILLFILIQSQSTYNMLNAELNEDTSSHREDS